MELGTDAACVHRGSQVVGAPPGRCVGKTGTEATIRFSYTGIALQALG